MGTEASRQERPAQSESQKEGDAAATLLDKPTTSEAQQSHLWSVIIGSAADANPSYDETITSVAAEGEAAAPPVTQPPTRHQSQGARPRPAPAEKRF